MLPRQGQRENKRGFPTDFFGFALATVKLPVNHGGSTQLQRTNNAFDASSSRMLSKRRFAPHYPSVASTSLN
jgi:hypothetical protein